MIRQRLLCAPRQTGFHDDCFVASHQDKGTYIDPSFDYPYLGNGTYH
jgi:hypothetical protein